MITPATSSVVWLIVDGILVAIGVGFRVGKGVGNGYWKQKLSKQFLFFKKKKSKKFTVGSGVGNGVGYSNIKRLNKIEHSI